MDSRFRTLARMERLTYCLTLICILIGLLGGCVSDSGLPATWPIGIPLQAGSVVAFEVRMASMSPVDRGKYVLFQRRGEYRRYSSAKGHLKSPGTHAYDLFLDYVEKHPDGERSAEALFFAGLCAPHVIFGTSSRISLEDDRLLLRARHWHDLLRQYPDSPWTGYLLPAMVEELEAVGVVMGWKVDATLSFEEAKARLLHIVEGPIASPGHAEVTYVQDLPASSRYRPVLTYSEHPSAYTYELALDVLARSDVPDALSTIKARLTPERPDYDPFKGNGLGAEIDYLVHFEGRRSMDVLIPLMGHHAPVYDAIEKLVGEEEGLTIPSYGSGVDLERQRREFAQWWAENKERLLTEEDASCMRNGVNE